MTGGTRTSAGEGGRRSRPVDEDLLPLVAEGDARAFAALYDRHARAAFSLALRMTGERQAAEDLAQDAFLKVWLSASSYRPERGSVRTWVLSIVQNRGIDQLRSQASCRRAWSRAEQSAPRSQPSEAFEEAWRNRRRERVRWALGTLPAEQLEIVELAYFSGHTHAEISGLLGLPLGTVKGRMRLAREKLRDRLGPGGKATPDRGRVPPEAAIHPSTRPGNATHPIAEKGPSAGLACRISDGRPPGARAGRFRSPDP